MRTPLLEIFRNVPRLELLHLDLYTVHPAALPFTLAELSSHCSFQLRKLSVFAPNRGDDTVWEFIAAQKSLENLSLRFVRPDVFFDSAQLHLHPNLVPNLSMLDATPDIVAMFAERGLPKSLFHIELGCQREWVNMSRMPTIASLHLRIPGTTISPIHYIPFLPNIVALRITVP